MRTKRGLAVAVLMATATLAGCARAHVTVRGEVYEARKDGFSEHFAGGIVRSAPVDGRLTVPVKEATVEVYQTGANEWDRVPLARTRTDAEGAFRLAFVTFPYLMEKFHVLVSHEDFLPARKNLIYLPGRKYAMDVTMVRREAADLSQVKGPDPLEEIRRREYSDPAQRLLDPLRIGQQSFLHQLIYIPHMESAYTLQTGYFRFNGGEEVYSQSATGQGTYNRFKASVSEIYGDLIVGLDRRLDARLGFALGKIDTDQLNGIQLFRNNNPNDPLFDRTIPVGFSPKRIGGRIRFAFWNSADRRTATAFSAGSNLGIGYQDFISTGGLDHHVSFLVSHEFGNVILHANAGYAVIGEQKVFTDDPVTGREIRTQDVQFGGLSLVYPMPRFQDAAAILQVQGNTNAFRDLDILNESPATAHAGARLKLFDLVFEIEGGVGLTAASSDTVFSANAGRMF